MSLATAANTAFLLANLPAAARFRRALKSPAATQREILTRYLTRNAATHYGTLHHFARIPSPEEFQQRLPITDYEDYHPLIHRIAAGERNILTAEPVQRFALTSGSAGAEKWIPYTRSLTAEFRRGISPWLANLYTALPTLRRGPAYWSITPVGSSPQPRDSKIPVGFDEDSAYLGGIFKRLVDAALVVPAELRHLQNIDTFRYLTLLCLLRNRNLRLISIWHPSFLPLLLQALPEFWERLLEDIHRGTLHPPSDISAELRRALHPRPDPRRATELRRLGPHTPASFWPNLTLLSCWTHAHAQLPAQNLAALFPHTTLQGKGLLSTEAFISLPLIDAGTIHHPLAIRSHFFKFLPDSSTPGTPVLALAAEPGATYTLLITTAGGLYRYNTHDRVRITGRHHQTPCLEFLGKSDLTSDLCGEKLNALFVEGVLTTLRQSFDLAPTFLMLAPDAGPGYTLFIESPGTLPADLPESLDAGLSQNPHYAYCRRLGQLTAARVFHIQSNAAATYLETCRQRGQRLGDIKPTPLHCATDWRSKFTGHFLADSQSVTAVHSVSARG